MDAKQKSILSGVLIYMTLGSAYSISSWNARLEAELGLSNAQITALSAMASFGMYLSPIPGAVYDYFGVKRTIRMAAVAMCVSYTFLYVSVAFWSDFIPQWMRCGCFFLIGQAGGLAASSVLGANEGLYGADYRGKIVGLLMASFGLGGAFYTYIYHLFFDPNVALYFLFLGLNLTAVCFLGQKFLLPSDFAALEANRHVSYATLDPIKVVNVTGLALFRRKEYWLLVACMIPAIASALLVMNNMAFIVQAAGGEASVVPLYVALFSICNTASRLGAGYLSDHTRHLYPRTMYLYLSISIALTAQLLFLLVPVWIILLPICLSGIAEGFMFSIFPVLTREFFGPVHLGKNFGFLSLANAFGYPLFLQPLSSWLYHSLAGEGDTCLGSECYGPMFGLCSILCCVGLMCAKELN